MSSQSFSQEKGGLRRLSPFVGAASQSRRTGHGGNLWSLPLSVRELRQPQDGALDTRAHLSNIASHLSSDALFEPEDAGLTGGTRSLTRRLLGLNVSAKRKSPESSTPITIRALVA